MELEIFVCPEDKIAYSQMHRVFDLIASMDRENSVNSKSKSEKQNRNDENRRQILDFIADNGISDSKSISKAIGLKPSRTTYNQEYNPSTSTSGATSHTTVG